MLLVHMGSPEEGERFLGERWPEARAVSDPNKRLYEAFGLRPGRPGQYLGPRVWWSGFRALVRGHGFGRPVGDPRMMTGWFLIERGRVVWEQVHESTGEARRWEELMAAYRAIGQEAE